MTPKAEKLANENYKLIYKFMRKYKIDEESIHDYYGLLAEAFCKACEDYDESFGYEFSTLAFRYMSFRLNIFRHELNAIKRKTNSAIAYSLDEALFYNKVEKTMQERLTDEKAGMFTSLVDNRIDNINTINKIWDVATDAQREYMVMMYDGLNGAEIARRLNITKQAVNIRRNQILKNCQKNNIVYEG